MINAMNTLASLVNENLKASRWWVHSFHVAMAYNISMQERQAVAVACAILKLQILVFFINSSKKPFNTMRKRVL
jgi:hypothetical protein